MAFNYDFSGYATKYNVRCSDGRTIKPHAFDDQDGEIVPLVWMHGHDDNSNVLGHALLEKRSDGMYMYGSFNDTPRGRNAKVQVEHGDIDSISIFANGLNQTKTSKNTADVTHGEIKEVSLVFSGANIGAKIDVPIVAHSDDYDEYAITLDDATIYPGEYLDSNPGKLSTNETIEHADKDKKVPKRTVKDVYDEMTEEQKLVVAFMANELIKVSEEDNNNNDEAKHSDKGGNDMAKKNVFENNGVNSDSLSHAEIYDSLRNDIRDLLGNKDELRHVTSLKNTILSHAEGAYGITNIDYLFPDAKEISSEPDFVKRDDSWVSKFFGAAGKTPFARIKTIHADITEDEARAKGYIKGNKKKDEVFTLLKRSTDPTTIYKKQKIDRDDVIDITDINIISWIQKEMRTMLDEEIARAGLVGDGRLSSSDDKIPEDKIRPIYTDDDLYSVKIPVAISASDDDSKKAEKLIDAIIKARKQYKGSGNPTLFTTTDNLTLSVVARVKEIVEVEVMEGLSRNSNGSVLELAGIVVNPADYRYGANRGGEINAFDDFDIDFNQYKYLLETRCSGALVKPKSALVVEFTSASAEG